MVNKYLLVIKNVLSLMKIKTKYVCKRIIRSFICRNKKVRKYPLTIQLPITYKCNFNCIMCGMQNLISNKDYSVQELDRILEDRLFKKVTAIGLNGGEPFLRPDLIECVEVMVKRLKKLKSINIISNGYLTNIIKEKLLAIKKICSEYGVEVNVSFSIDGVGEMQDYMRGKPNAWLHVIQTINELSVDGSNYYDSLGVICTVTKKNVFNLEELEAWGNKHKIFVRYNIATVNARIANEDRYDDFSIFTDEKARLTAEEFFYKKAIQDNSEIYFGLFLYIRDRKRYGDCECQYNEWVTLAPNGNIAYCATYSKELGCAIDESAYDIFNRNVDELNRIKQLHCDSCSHYMGRLNKIGLKIFCEEIMKNNRIVF